MLKDLQNRLEAFGFYLLVGFLKLLGLRRASCFGGFLTRNIGPLTSKHAKAKRRLLRAMPETTDAEAEKILHGMWDNLGRTIAEIPHLVQFRDFDKSEHIEFVGEDIVDKIRQSGCGAILISGHFANWEVMPLLLKHIEPEGASVYRAANNPYVDRYIVQNRERNICAVQVPKGGPGARQLIRFLRKKQLIAMLIDQKMNDGISVPFFGIPAMTPAAAAQLSLRFDVPIVPASIIRLSGPNFRMTLHEPISFSPTGERAADVAALMTLVNKFLEERIRERPHEWLWIHRRWPE